MQKKKKKIGVHDRIIRKRKQILFEDFYQRTTWQALNTPQDFWVAVLLGYMTPKP